MDDESTEIQKTIVDNAFNFLGKIINPPLEELGLLAQDQIKFWRFKNQVRMLNKAQQSLAAKGINPRKVPLKTIAPLLEYSSLEEDENVQGKWAALLAKAADPSFSIDLCTIYIEILRQLSPHEVRILDLMFQAIEKTPPMKGNWICDHNAIRESIGVSVDHYGVMMENLSRLNLLKPQSEIMTMDEIGRIKTPEDDLSAIRRLSYFGMSFVRYCK